MQNEYTPDNFMDCPMAEIQPIIQGKWTMLILYYISQETIRFGELSRKIPMVSQANLTKALRSLEQFGLIHREVYREVPPKVEYSLTEIGQKFLPVLEALETFGLEYRNMKEESEEEHYNLF